MDQKKKTQHYLSQIQLQHSLFSITYINHILLLFILKNYYKIYFFLSFLYNFFFTFFIYQPNLVTDTSYFLFFKAKEQTSMPFSTKKTQSRMVSVTSTAFFFFSESFG
jgi:hypothetical protein